MSFPKYPDYVESGIRWLGAIPAHWRLKPLWTCFKRTKRTGYADESLLSVYRDYGVILKSSRDDNFNKPSDDLTTYQLVERGDLAINKMKAWQGSVAVSEFRGIVSPAYFVFEATHRECSRFLHYLMRSASYVTGYLSISEGVRVNQWDLDPQLHSRIPLLLPPLDEQEKIATFLDHETTKIDALVEEQEKLVTLLKEKRQAVISQAVTKGLDPKVPMRDSGVEWLGEMPAHWQLMPLARTASSPIALFIDGDWIESKDLADEGVRYITTGNVGEGVYREQGAGYISVAKFEELQCTEVLPGDVLISRLNLPIGRACIAPDLGIPIVTSVDNVIFRPDPDFDRRFMVYLLSSKAHYANMENLARGTTMQRISRSALGRVQFAFPPLAEQCSIAAFLDRETAQIDALVTEVQFSVNLLRERRAALISAAVTGKIDLRGYVQKPETV